MLLQRIALEASVPGRRGRIEGRPIFPLRAGFLFFIPLLCLFVIFPSGAMAGFDISGSYKSYFTAYDPPGYSLEGDSVDEPLEALALNRARLNIFWTITDTLSAEMAYDLVPTLQPVTNGQSVANFLPGTNQSCYRFDDLHSMLYPGSGEPEGSFSVGQNLDRLYFIFAAEYFDLFIGRQPITFGSARVINPTDILAPFTYQDLDTEERIGVDAVRLKIPFGTMNEFDLGFVCGPDCHTSENAAFLRSRFYLAGNDISLLACLFKENLLAGFDLMRSVGGAGFWFEMAHTWVDSADGDSSNGSDDYSRLSTGFDYNLGDGLYGYIEYHYNSAGHTNPVHYLDSIDQIAYTQGNVYQLGEHYLTPGIKYQVTPLLTADLVVLVNLNDPSSFFSSSLEYSLTEDVYFRIGAYVGTGQEARIDFISGEPTLVPRSEFGLYPTFYYSSIRAYF